MVSVNKERVQLLVDALRSGEFRQGKNVLRDVKGNPTQAYHCCLGVATEIALRNGLQIERPDRVGIEDEDFSDAVEEARSYPWDMSEQTMCAPVAEWFGLDQNPVLVGQRDTGHDEPDVLKEQATYWNDNGDADFSEIADMFEATYVTETTPLTNPPTP